MKLVIITDTSSFKLKLIDDVLRRVAFDPRHQRVESITFYGVNSTDAVFVNHLRRNFPGVEIRRHLTRVPVRPGKQPNWRNVIRNEVKDEPDAGFMLTLVVSERFDSYYFNLIHTGVINNIAMARSVDPTVSDDILFTRTDGLQPYLSNSSYPLTSLNIYKD